MNSAFDAQGAGFPKLPLWETIWLAYSTTFRNFRDVLRISWIWLVVSALVSGTVTWLQMSRMAVFIADMKRGVPTQQVSMPIETIALGYLGNLFFALAGISIAVAWHRRLILGENVAFCGSNIASKVLWRYAGVGIAIILIAAVPVVGIGLPIFFWPVAMGGEFAPPDRWLLALLFLLNLVAIAIMLRLSLLLPASAVGNTDLRSRMRGIAHAVMSGEFSGELRPARFHRC